MWRDALSSFVFAAALLLVLLPESTAFASGSDSSGREDDIRFSADWRWAGGQQGGYYPIRISLQNAGPPRTIEVLLKASSNGIPDVSRRVSVDQNASAAFALLVPLVGDSSYGQLRVYANGRELESLRTHVSLPDHGWDDCPLATLVIADTPPALAEYEAAVASLMSDTSPSHLQPTTDCQHIEPVRLPDTWLAYSSVDLVIMSIETLEQIDGLQRKAILDWVLAGGCLVLSSSGEQGQPLQQTIDSLVGGHGTPANSNWMPVPLRLRQPVQRIERDQYGNEVSSKPGTTVNFHWPSTEDLLQVRRHGIGRLVTLPSQPFEGTYQDWAWLLNGLQFEEQVLPTRLGVSGRGANREFFQFLIPGVRSVPVISFAVVITLFALLIGPVNYYVLAKRKRQGFLVVTIPAIALLSSLALFAYSFVAHGVSVRSRVRSVTVIDQSTQSAVSMARIAWFAGFAPSDGLVFSNATAVIPIWHSNSQFTNGRVDWTESQRLASGFLPSRTRTQALTLSVRDERGRLIVTPPVSGDVHAAELHVTNGLEWPLETLIVWDDTGRAFSTGAVAPEQAVTLTPLSEQARNEFLDRLQQSAPEIPADLRLSTTGQLINVPQNNANYSVSAGRMEELIGELRQGIRAEHPDSPRLYVAIAAQPPGIELGTDVTIVDGWHLIVGRY